MYENPIGVYIKYYGVEYYGLQLGNYSAWENLILNNN